MDDLDLYQSSQLFEKSKFSALNFLQNVQSIFIECDTLPQPVGVLKHEVNLFCTINIQGRELYGLPCDL